jgi:hypothetical protein
MTIRNMQARMLVAAVAMLGVSASVTAGFRHTNRTVIVNQTTRYAEGQLAGARASSDGTQYIGCNTWARDDLPGQDGGASRHGVCYVSDARGVSAVCVTSEPALLDVIASIQGDSWINFTWNANNACINIESRQASSQEPKR